MKIAKMLPLLAVAVLLLNVCACTDKLTTEKKPGSEAKPSPTPAPKGK